MPAVRAKITASFVCGGAPACLRCLDGSHLHSTSASPRWQTWCLAIADFALNAVPRGCSQVCFVDNPWAGAAVFAALSAPMPWHYGVCMLVALVASTLTGAAVAADEAGVGAVRHGIFSFNGCLVGAALSTFGDFSSTGGAAAMIALAAAGGVLSTWLQLAITAITSRLDVPTFTMPFNLTALVLLGCIAQASTAPLSHLTDFAGAMPNSTLIVDGQPLTFPSAALAPVAPALRSPTTLAAGSASRLLCYIPAPVAAAQLLSNCSVISAPASSVLVPPAAAACASTIMAAVVRGVAQVYFCDSAASGAVVVAAFALGSPVLAAMALLGSAAGLATGVLLRGSPAALDGGLYGYNGVIAAMSAVVFFRLTWRVALCIGTGTAILATGLFVLLRPVFLAFGLPILTLPFCLSAFVSLLAGSGPGWQRYRLHLSEAAMPEGTASCGWLRRARSVLCADEDEAHEAGEASSDDGKGDGVAAAPDAVAGVTVLQTARIVVVSPRSGPDAGVGAVAGPAATDATATAAARLDGGSVIGLADEPAPASEGALHPITAWAVHRRRSGMEGDVRDAADAAAARPTMALHLELAGVPVSDGRGGDGGSARHARRSTAAGYGIGGGIVSGGARRSFVGGRPGSETARPPHRRSVTLAIPVSLTSRGEVGETAPTSRLGSGFQGGGGGGGHT